VSGVGGCGYSHDHSSSWGGVGCVDVDAVMRGDGVDMRLRCYPVSGCGFSRARAGCVGASFSTPGACCSGEDGLAG